MAIWRSTALAVALQTYRLSAAGYELQRVPVSRYASRQNRGVPYFLVL